MTNKKQKNIFHAMIIHSGICGSINLKRYFLKNIIPTDEIVHTDELSSHRLQMNTDYFPCGGTRIISNTNKPNRTNFPSGSHF